MFYSNQLLNAHVLKEEIYNYFYNNEQNMMLQYCTILIQSTPKMEEQNQRHETLILKKQYNELLADKHRLEQEIERLKRFREEDRKEVNELQRQQQVKKNS